MLFAGMVTQTKGNLPGIAAPTVAHRDMLTERGVAGHTRPAATERHRESGWLPMHVDTLTLAELATELRGGLMGARIEDVIQPTPHAVALQCWGGGRTAWLLASAHPQFARVHLLERKPQKLAAEPPPFVMLLRKHLEGARLIDVRQPPWERVLELGFARGPRDTTVDAEPPRVAVWLVVEIMGRLSNLIARDAEGMILGALRLVGPEVNRYRTIAPNELYRPPPPQTRLVAGVPAPRLEAERVGAAALRAAALERLAEPANPKHPARLAGLLAAHLLGFSQEMAREVAARALDDPGAPLAADLPWERVADEARALAALLTTEQWQPTLVLAASVSDDQDGARGARGADEGEPIAYAVYAPRQYADAELRAMPGASALLAAYYRRAEWRDAVVGAKAPLHRLLTLQRERCVRKADILAAELDGLRQRDRLREEGDLLLTFQTQVPKGASGFTVDSPFAHSDDATAPVTLALDPRYSAVENANRRFARYHKLRRAAALIPPQQEANQIELARIEQLLSDLDLADTTAEITHVREEVAEAGYLRGKRADAGRGQRGGGSGGGNGRPTSNKSGKGKAGKAGKPAKPGAKGAKGGAAGGTPLRRQSTDGLALLVGKNSRQNEEVTFRLATSGDLWLHARGVPGAHVIVKSGGRPIPESTLREAAALAAYYSQSRQAGSVPVDYTEQRHVRHMKGGGPGMVLYERERTLHVAPADREDASSAAR